MRMAELIERSGTPLATVKYYLREGLLHPGVATAATRATYDDSHIARLRLIRVLAEVAGMRLAQIRGVLTAIEDDSVSLHDALGCAHRCLAAGPALDEAARVEMTELMHTLDWNVAPQSPALGELARALTAIRSFGGLVGGAEVLQTYAEAMHQVAEAEVGSVPTADRAAAVTHVVVGTLLAEPVLLALRRLAHQDISSRRFGGQIAGTEGARRSERPQT